MKELTILEELLLAHPDLSYENGELVSDGEVVETDGDWVIARHFDDFDSLEPNGKDYVERNWFGRYADALANVEIPKL